MDSMYSLSLANFAVWSSVKGAFVAGLNGVGGVKIGSCTTGAPSKETGDGGF